MAARISGDTGASSGSGGFSGKTTGFGGSFGLSFPACGAGTSSGTFFSPLRNRNKTSPTPTIARTPKSSTPPAPPSKSKILCEEFSAGKGALTGAGCGAAPAGRGVGGGRPALTPCCDSEADLVVIAAPHCLQRTFNGAGCGISSGFLQRGQGFVTGIRRALLGIAPLSRSTGRGEARSIRAAQTDHLGQVLGDVGSFEEQQREGRIDEGAKRDVMFLTPAAIRLLRLHHDGVAPIVPVLAANHVLRVDHADPFQRPQKVQIANGVRVKDPAAVAQRGTAARIILFAADGFGHECERLVDIRCFSTRIRPRPARREFLVFQQGRLDCQGNQASAGAGGFET